MVGVYFFIHGLKAAARLKLQLGWSFGKDKGIGKNKAVGKGNIEEK